MVGPGSRAAIWFAVNAENTVTDDKMYESPSPNDSQPDAYQPVYPAEPTASAPSGLKLKLPPLKPAKPVKGSKKSKHRSRFSSPLFSAPQDEIGEVKKAPRPLKLKPLKEVLSKLIAQIKKCVFIFSGSINLKRLRVGKTTMHSSYRQWTCRKFPATRIS